MHNMYHTQPRRSQSKVNRLTPVNPFRRERGFESKIQIGSHTLYNTHVLRNMSQPTRVLDHKNMLQTVGHTPIDVIYIHTNTHTRFEPQNMKPLLYQLITPPPLLIDVRALCLKQIASGHHWGLPRKT